MNRTALSRIPLCMCPALYLALGLALGLSVFPALPASGAEDGHAIMTRVYDRADGDDRHSENTMPLVNKQGR